MGFAVRNLWHMVALVRILHKVSGTRVLVNSHFPRVIGDICPWGVLFVWQFLERHVATSHVDGWLEPIFAQQRSSLPQSLRWDLYSRCVIYQEWQKKQGILVSIIILCQIASAQSFFFNLIVLFSSWISILQVKLSFMTYLDLHENELIWKPILQMDEFYRQCFVLRR